MFIKTKTKQTNKQVRCFVKHDIKTNKQTGETCYQNMISNQTRSVIKTWYQNKQTGEMCYPTWYQIKDDIKTNQQINRWDAFFKTNLSTVELLQVNFPWFEIIKISRVNIQTNAENPEEILLTLHFFQRRGFLNILSWFETGQEKCVDFCSVAIEFAKIEFVKYLDSTFKLLYVTSLQLHKIGSSKLK